MERWWESPADGACGEFAVGGIDMAIGASGASTFTGGRSV